MADHMDDGARHFARSSVDRNAVQPRGTHARSNQVAPQGTPAAGTRFRAAHVSARGGIPAGNATQGYGAHASSGAARHAAQANTSAARARTRTYHHGLQPVHRRQARASAASSNRRTSPLAIAIPLIAVIAVVAVLAIVVFPIARDMVLGSAEPAVEAGVEVQVEIPQGASGDQIASILSQDHIIENPKEYYAAVRNMQADSLLKPGTYRFTTLQDPEEVVQQLIDGPNVEGASLTIPEGFTVEQTAAKVESTYGIAADDFLAQAKASNYSDDYPFLKDAYNDSLEGYLYPKTYTFSGDPTADDIIRAMLDQFKKEIADLDLTAGPDNLSAQQIVSLASLVERESSVESERPLIASVIYNRLDKKMPLQIDAAIVYARGGGSDPVTYDDLKIDSPYNLYEHTGLTPGPICSPSISSIKAALAPANTDYLYYVASASHDGTHVFSETYDEFRANSKAYSESVS